MKILITAGPTLEMLDDVRYFSNMATGALGIMLAERLALKSHDTTLVLGPTHLQTKSIRKLTVINVESAIDMYNAVRVEFPYCNVFISSAAVADYRPKVRIQGKLKKHLDVLNLELVQTPDILAEMGAIKTSQLTIGFALETSDFIENAQKKLFAKRCDFIIVNTPANFGETGKDQITILNKIGIYKEFEYLSKNQQVSEIIKLFIN
jgi:phosphopantothenoylcysteine decarboxylase/phosphopantothenate--cysteine ligase